MPRLINPVEWAITHCNPLDPLRPILSLHNSNGHQFHIQPTEQGLVRVVHSLPEEVHKARLRNHRRQDVHAGADGFQWEERQAGWHAAVDETSKQAWICRAANGSAEKAGASLTIHVDYSYTVTLSWYWQKGQGGSASTPFLRDFKSAYMYDARTQRVYHQVCREQSYMPLSEHVVSANDNHVPQRERFEYLYGLGETKGPMMKDGKSYIIDAKDSLAADPQETDPLYKLCPFYLHYNHRSKMWYGLYYNTLSPSIFDFSGEHDFATGEFRSFTAEAGPLDYYLLLGTEGQPPLPSIVSQLARLVTPRSTGPAGNESSGWQASPTLPPLNQFGYLASSLTLSERLDAQQAVVEYVTEARKNGFPMDAMHLSSGYAVDSCSGERNYFTWDPIKYPDPLALGQRLERQLACKVIINVKPWLLESHPSYVHAANQSAFVRAALDSRPLQRGGSAMAPDRCGPFASEPARTMHWSKGMGVTGKGSYFDYSSRAGCAEWQRLMTEGVLQKSITGVWIDNNEFSSLIDDEEEIKGDINMWSLPAGVGQQQDDVSAPVADQIAARMGWGGGPIAVGSVGRAVLTMGMARATFEHLYRQLPDQRPVLVTRSAVPGMQVFAHATWSGDNSTSWLSLKWSTKLSLSVGLSFGMGLYGHDIGGFAGEHSPSPQLLVRWCQQSMWYTRFTIHSWKKISTTPWMYGQQVTDIIRKVIERRYRLVPMLYSLYVTHYHRHGWPVIKPLLWYHSNDQDCLGQDEQFLVGSHVLVAPVCEYGKTSISFHLPDAVADEEVSYNTCWFEQVENKWHHPVRGGSTVTLDAPLDRCPVLVREGGIIVLGPIVTDHLSKPAPPRHTRTVELYPTPANVLQERPCGQDVSRGTFVLVEDDGVSNQAAENGLFTEIEVSFEADREVVTVAATVKRGGYAGTWDLHFVLPPGDVRELQVVDEGSVIVDAATSPASSTPSVCPTRCLQVVVARSDDAPLHK